MKYSQPLLILIYISLASHMLMAAEIYQWKDIEGVQQFSNKPPPLSCKTPSCLKLQKKITKNIKLKKDLELAHIQAAQMKLEQQRERAREQKRIQQQQVIKLTPGPENNTDKTFLPIATITCVSLNNIREYTNVTQARKYLERDQLCVKVNQQTEYTIIEKQDKFSNIRVYFKDGNSQQKWVETKSL